MSFEFAILTTPERLPKWDAWNAALQQNGFDIALDNFEWNGWSGFLPAQLLGVRTGFELYNIPVEQPRSFLGLLSRKQPHQCRIAARLLSSEVELVVATCALAVLQSLTGGTFSDDDNQVLSIEEHVQEARKVYDRARFILTRLGTDVFLDASEPPLGTHETTADRAALAASLVQQGVVVEESAATIPRFQLEKNYAKRLREEIAEVTSSYNESQKSA
ncbi:MAG: hypothetical protein U0640_08035 [Phycisphaerales bacterium]